MLAALPDGGRERLIGAMAVIESLLGASGHSLSPAVLRGPRAGDMGWVVQSHGSLYAREYGFNSSFESLVAEISAKFLASFDASRERCWIAELDGARVGSVFLVRHTDDVAKLRLLLSIRPGVARDSANGWSPNACPLRGNAAIAKSRCGPRASWSPPAGYIRMRLRAGSAANRTGRFGQSLIGETWERDLGT